jgi:hypothetical protein
MMPITARSTHPLLREFSVEALELGRQMRHLRARLQQVGCTRHE